jgi:hypothetical protein
MRAREFVPEVVTNEMSVKDMIAYLRQHHDRNLHPDYLNHLTDTNSKFVLKTIPLTALRTELSGLDRAKVEQYKQMDFSKAPPIVVGSDGNILDGYHRATVAKALGVPSIRAYVGMAKQGVSEGDKMSRIDLGSALANTPPEWQKFVNSLPPQLAREFVDERPRPDQSDIDFLTPLRLISPQPVAVRVADLLRHPENQATIGRSPDDVVAAVNQRWGLKVPSGKKYDPNPARYRAYAQMTSGTASPSVMADGVILFGAGRFVAAALRGDETMRVWSMTRKPGVSKR